MNDVYHQVQIVYKDDQSFIDKLIDAELAWISFRDAQLEAIYPERNRPGRYGSVFPMTYALEKTRLTWARVRQLREWLDGLPAEQNTGGQGIDYSRLSGGQPEMEYAVADEANQAEDALNNAYRQILIIYKNKEVFIDKLTDAELAWIAFRDAPNLKRLMQSGINRRGMAAFTPWPAILRKPD